MHSPPFRCRIPPIPSFQASPGPSNQLPSTETPLFSPGTMNWDFSRRLNLKPPPWGMGSLPFERVAFTLRQRAEITPPEHRQPLAIPRFNPPESLTNSESWPPVACLLAIHYGFLTKKPPNKNCFPQPISPPGCKTVFVGGGFLVVPCLILTAQPLKPCFAQVLLSPVNVMISPIGRKSLVARFQRRMSGPGLIEPGTTCSTPPLITETHHFSTKGHPGA